jgi:hypothetical protein
VLSDLNQTPLQLVIFEIKTTHICNNKLECSVCVWPIMVVVWVDPLNYLCVVVAGPATTAACVRVLLSSAERL